MFRVLIADDDPVQLELRRHMVEAAGYDVALAFCPAEALRQIGKADVVVMDLRFPNAAGKADAAEGLELIRRIRERGYAGPLIVLSGWPEELDEQPELRLVSSVMIKPVGMAALLSAIRQSVTAVSAPSPNPPSTGL